MSMDFELTLGPRALGVEVLVHIGRQRLSGTLSWGPQNKRRELTFHEGRPEMGLGSDGSRVGDKKSVVALTRKFAAASAGVCVFRYHTPRMGGSLGIDTLGESLISLLHHVRATQLDGFWAARARYRVEATSSFPRVNAVLGKLGAATIAQPAPGTSINDLISGKELAEQRSYAALLTLGALQTDAPPLAFRARSAPAEANTTESEAAQETETQAAEREIRQAYQRLGEQNHYAVLGISSTANADQIKKSYFSLAKKYHSDRLGSLGVSADMIRQAEEIFRRIDEANQVLSDAEQRSSYDWVLARQEKGLPTDPKIILEAESIFRHAEGLLRRGQAAAAEPLLREAVQLNKGEAEFWACLGYAVYALNGSSSLQEAKENLNRALALNEKLDIAYEFLGRIDHVEGNKREAAEHLRQALSLNPNNNAANMELRLLQMRAQEGADKAAAKKKGVLARLLKRS